MICFFVVDVIDLFVVMMQLSLMLKSKCNDVNFFNIEGEDWTLIT
jgi:hypothetical protein